MNVADAVAAHPGLATRLGNVSRVPEAATPVLSAKIKLLWQCNLSCLFCKRPSAGPLLDRDAVGRILRSLAADGLRKVHFSGGEVMLHPGIFDIVDDASALGLQVNLTSNGTLLDKEGILRLERGLHSISLSLDAPEARLHDRIRGMKGAFGATMKAARRIAAKGRIRLRINTVLGAFNSGAMDAMHDLVRSLGDDVRWKIIPVDAAGAALRAGAAALEDLDAASLRWRNLDRWRVSQHPSRWLRDLSRGRYGAGRSLCFAPWLHIFIDPAGRCHPCCMLRGTSASWGDATRDEPSAIRRGRIAQELRMAVAAGCPPRRCSRCDDFIEENEAIHEILAGGVQ